MWKPPGFSFLLPGLYIAMSYLARIVDENVNIVNT